MLKAAMDQSISSDLLMILGALFVSIGLLMDEIGRMRFYFFISTLIFLFYGFTTDTPAIIAGSCIFLAINGYFLTKIPLKLKSVQLPARLVDIYPIYRHYITEDDFVRIMENAEHKTFMKETLIEEGDISSRLYFIITGHANVIKEGKVIATLSPGDFIGEIGILTGNKSQATVSCKGIAEVAMWTKTVVQHENKLKQMISINLIDKLTQLNTSAQKESE